MDREKPLVLITGISGRIGCKVAASFSPFAQIVGMDLVPFEGKCPVSYLPIDLSSDESVKSTLQQVKERHGNKIASVIHLAAYYNFAGGMWERYEKITIGGTRRLLENLQDFEVEQFIFSSTLLVYAHKDPGNKIREDSLLDPSWEYPLSKVKTEELIHKMGGEMQTSILRIAGVYDDYCHSIPISQQILRIYRKELESHFYPGNAGHGAPFLHMDDLVDAILKIFEQRKTLARQECFVLGEEKTLSYRQLQNEIGLLLHGKPWKTFWIPKWFAKMGAWARENLPFLKKSFIKPWMVDLADTHHELDISHARQVLGWQPNHSLEETLPKMINVLNEDPETWLKDHLI